MRFRHGRHKALLLGLVLALSACSGETPATPDTEGGDQIEGRLADLDPGERSAVVTPAGRLKIGFGDPVDSLDKEKTTDLTARTAPGGGSFVPIVWSFQDDIFGQISRIFGDRQPLEVELVADGKSYPLSPPATSSGEVAEYVAVAGPAEEVSLEVTYDELTQTLDAETGKVDKGVAKGLYDLTKTKLKLKDCPIKGWFTQPGVFPQYTCQYTTAVPTPYVVNEWVKSGHTWLAVTVSTNLALYATGELNGSLASYRVVDSSERSTIDGKKPLGTLQEDVNQGAAFGTLVYDIKGKLPKTMDLRREYKLTLSGATGKSSAPQKRTVRIGGEIKLSY